MSKPVRAHGGSNATGHPRHHPSRWILRNTVSAWGAPAKLFHWLLALLVLAQFALGWSAVTWRMSPVKLDLFVWHKSIGMLVLLLAVLRLVWRLANPTPRLPAALPPWERRAAQYSHAALYVALIAMPVSGWIIHSAAGVPFRIFWRLPLPPLLGPDKVLADVAALIHFALFVAFAVLLVLHVGAALRHHFIARNGLLERMLPSWRVPP